MTNFIIATAGHVDHGKSALVKALTGTDPDRLPEEKARQITIDLGFAELNLAGNGGEQFHAGIVDVPGHEDFVRNMIAGVGSIDLALFVIAVDDGWMPQTEEHLQILTYLGVSRAVIALTKTDLGGVEKVSDQVRGQLRGTNFANSPIIPTSTRTGDGIGELKSALGSTLSVRHAQRDIGKPRLFVDRAFTLHGIGTVVTGTLAGGILRCGQKIVIQPRNCAARIRSIQNHGRDAEVAMPGMRTALNLPDLKIGTGDGAIARGDAITTMDLEASSVLNVALVKSSRLGDREPAGRPLKHGTSIYLYHGTARVGAKIFLFENSALKPGETVLAQLRLESPVFAFVGDRFVVRDRSERNTIAGGIVLDPCGDTKTFRSPAQRTLLNARATAPGDVEASIISELAAHGPRQSAVLLQRSQFSVEEIAASLTKLENRDDVVMHDAIVAMSGTWKDLRNRAIAEIDIAHKQNSDRPGLDINLLRTAFREQPPEVVDAIILDLCANGFVRNGSTIRRTEHRASLLPYLNPIAERILATLGKEPFDPPARKEIAHDPTSQQVLRFLIQRGDVVEISADIILARDAFARMRETIVEFISKNGPSTVSQLRQELRSSRRIVVPLLERLDRDGITQRSGDTRKVRDEISSRFALK